MPVTVTQPLIWIFLLCGHWCLLIFVEGLDCGYPGSPAHGRPHPLRDLYRPGEAVSFVCSQGLALHGPMQRVCLPNGTWAGQLPLCDRSLSSVDHVASSRQTLTLYPADMAIDGDSRTCTYTEKLRPRWLRVDMRQEYRVRAIAITVPSGIYSQSAAQLTIYVIRVKDSTTASYHKCASFNGRFSATTLKLSCSGGEEVGRYIHIEDNRNKVDYFSLCEVQVFVNKGSYECGEAERPARAYSVRTESGATQYRCVYGYRLVGTQTRHCMENGQWSPSQPICHEIICPHLDEVDHGRVVYAGRQQDQLTLATVANVTCEYGYRTSGAALRCEENGLWSEGSLSCEPVDCGLPVARHDSESYVVLNGTTYGSVVLLQCGSREAVLSCREDGTWSSPDIDCEDENLLSRLGLVEEEQNDVPTGIVIGMAVVVFILLVLVVLVLLMKRRKTFRRSSTESLPSKETNSTLAANSPQPYENDTFYATIPVDNQASAEIKKNFMSTILFPRKKASDSNPVPGDKKNSIDSTSTQGCIYEEIGSKSRLNRKSKSPPNKEPTGDDRSDSQPVYAQVDFDEKRKSRLLKSLTERFEPAETDSLEEGTYRGEPPPTFDDVDLEPIKLRELPPIPDDGSDITYASLSLPLDPPTLVIKVHDQPKGVTSAFMKDNDLYT